MPRPRFAASLPALLLSAAPLAANPLASVIGSGDWNGDGFPDRVVITPTGQGEADIALYEGRADGREAQVIDLVEAIWAGPMFGQQPAVVTGETESFAIFSQNEAIGRNRWSKEITVTWREGNYYVTGYAYAQRDTLDPDAFAACQLDLLSGAYEIDINGESWVPAAPVQSPFLFADLTLGWRPEACAEAQE